MYKNNENLTKVIEFDKDNYNDINNMFTMGTEDKAFNIIMGFNLGNPTWVSDVKLSEFVEWSSIANNSNNGEITQRKLDTKHAKNLASFILKGLVASATKRRIRTKKEPLEAFEKILNILGKKPYCALQPIVANIREIDPYNPNLSGKIGKTEKGNTVGYQVMFPKTYTWWIIDGQHRRYAAEIVIEWLKYVVNHRKYPLKNSLTEFKGEVQEEHIIVWAEALNYAQTFATIKIEFHLGLSIEQEQQLFHDLNNLGKKVNISLATEFDRGNSINNFINDVLEKKLEIKLTDKEIKDWSKDHGKILKKDMMSINAIAFLNKTNAKNVSPKIITERQNIIEKLWYAIKNIPGFGEDMAKTKTVAAQPVVLKALAKITYDLIFSNRAPSNGKDIFKKMIANLNNINFSHNNKMWRYYQLSDEERKKEFQDLSNFLPDQGKILAEKNRDIGLYQNSVMRFGAKHNDIYPILADMIRWKLGLPNRHLNK